MLAHFNHRLRGAESDGDQTFVKELGRELGLPVMVGARGGDEEISESEESLRGRGMRFWRRRRMRQGAQVSWPVGADTADDQVETVLHNLLRGTGLAGLAGVRAAAAAHGSGDAHPAHALDHAGGGAPI